MSHIPFPAASAVLTAYRQILRYSNLKMRGKAARVDTLDSPFVDQVRLEFRAGKLITDPVAAWKAHTIATDLAAMLKSSSVHADALFEAGWCLNKPSEEAVKNVAAFVGFDMPITYEEGKSRVDNVLGAGATGTRTEPLEDIDIFGGSTKN